MNPQRLITTLWLLTTASCARSVQDRELDRVFAHQDWLRDSTVPIRGVVRDSAGLPIPGVGLVAGNLGDMSDTSGSFEIPYQQAGRVLVLASSPGYRPDSTIVVVHPPDTTLIRVTLRRAPPPCCSLVGQWHLVFQLDSSGPGQRPTARSTSGTIRFSPQMRIARPFGTGTPPSDPFVHGMAGVFDVAFSVFWGTPIAPDVSTSVMGPVTATFANEAYGRIFDNDSVEVDLIPRTSHGGVSLGGRLVGDTMTGTWVQRAYCCGAHGTVTMTRVSADPGPIIVQPEPAIQARDTLLETERGTIRVRVWDDAVGAYLHIGYAVGGPTGTTSGYNAGEEPGGWSRSFWLPPGRYKVLINSFLCRDKRYFLRKELSKSFEAIAGATTDVTLRLNTRTAKVARSYANHNGEPCGGG